MRILGIDPGLRLTGYACLERADDSTDTPAIVEAGVFRLDQRVQGEDVEGAHTKSAASVSARLVELDRDFRDALERLKPEVVAVESLFAHYKHPATAIVMGHARGVLRDYGNMSAATVMFVLDRVMAEGKSGRYLMSALGPGFSVGFLTLKIP